MKTIYSLKEFHEKATEISGKEANLVSVRVQLGLYGEYEFTCYADGYNNYTGSTMEESLKKMYEAIHQPAKNIDVEIEMPSEKELV